jgi:Family of unknown function (DUF6508)
MSNDLKTRWKTLHSELLLFSIFSVDEMDPLKLEVSTARITSALGALHLVQVFNWSEWIENRGGWPTLETTKNMDLNDCVRTLTAIVRTNRFNEGALAGSIRSGMFRALVRRAEELAHGEEVPAISES